MLSKCCLAFENLKFVSKLEAQSMKFFWKIRLILMYKLMMIILKTEFTAKQNYNNNNRFKVYSRFAGLKIIKYSFKSKKGNLPKTIIILIDECERLKKNFEDVIKIYVTQTGNLIYNYFSLSIYTYSYYCTVKPL